MRIVVLSGPEGGLTPTEEDAAVARGFVRVGLGPRVLRADTAPLAWLAWLGVRRSARRAIGHEPSLAAARRGDLRPVP